MGYTDTLRTISRRDFFRFAFAAGGMATLAVVSKYLQDQDPILQTENCLQTQFLKAGLAIKEGLTNPTSYDASLVQEIRRYTNELRGNSGYDKATLRLQRDSAITGTVTTLNQVENQGKIRLLREYALEIFRETALTEDEFKNLSDQQAAYVLLETAKRAKDIYLGTTCFQP